MLPEEETQIKAWIEERVVLHEVQAAKISSIASLVMTALLLVVVAIALH